LTNDPSSQSPERLHKRIQVALPLRVTYWDREHKICLDRACTYDISARGARITGLRDIKQAGEIITVERGGSKIFCRVVWVGDGNSRLQGQIGIQPVELDRAMWEAELNELEDVYDPILRHGILLRNLSAELRERERRRHLRVPVEGQAELLSSAEVSSSKLKDLSESGCLIAETPHLPGTELKLSLRVGHYDLGFKGQVRHSAPGLGQGIEFREIRKGDLQALRFLLRKLAEQDLEQSFQFEIVG